MSTFNVILLAILFCVMQIIFLKKANKKWIKYMPTFIGGIGVFIGFAIHCISYIPYVFQMNSQSVLSENQYFALTICVVFMPCLAGSLLGIAVAKFFGKKRLLYFLPFILSIIIYSGAVIMGLGMISAKEIVWTALFLVSGFFLCQGKFWGSIFGLIPAVIFMYMSTQYTGQVINIEMPLGVVIAIFYITCSILVYRDKLTL